MRIAKGGDGSAYELDMMIMMRLAINSSALEEL